MSIITSGVGRIGKDAVVRTAGSDKVTGFSIAMEDGFGDKKVTHWFDCNGWGKRYESVAPYLTKGSQVFVVGEQGEREYEGKVYKTLRLQTLDLVGSKKDSAVSAPRGSSTKNSPPEAGAGFEDDDIPF